ncbi:hypothetical protein OA78_1727 [Latilactobacillus curvatus]|uniref:Teichoic acid D-Ala incorporation-associated protein DltX n=2 Tax=Latilactobacillus curvatus TaxID=28038 RepID=A0ABN6GLR7_LATCU|nr:hypothetical protein OA78_1727 [Latilactobacillus curvatus]BBE26804.1 hypothetical protein NFHkm12_16300 [Latilactobacillus curvatus]BCX30304.1 hypothetical protein LTWDN19_08710 [Latilactobacillus curvatus]GED81683.1 hypothetical protein LCU01_05910 [Latilactobacillus curvatus]SMH69777.1 conserved hypothetical protein [Latilactobacillus curvatus]
MFNKRCGNFNDEQNDENQKERERDGEKMGQKILNFWNKPAVNFIGKTIIYFVILLILLYLYDYSGIGSPKFIYNEF